MRQTGNQKGVEFDEVYARVAGLVAYKNIATSS
jgi:hypothetical protein